MSFPYHDPYWRETADFLKQHVRSDESVLAPDIFWWLFDRMQRYAQVRSGTIAGTDWSVVHKGELGQLSQAYLRGLVETRVPVFANAVFVVWTSRKDLPTVDRTSDHVKALLEQIDGRWEDDATGNEPDPLFPDANVIVKFEALSPREFRAAMNAFWEAGGYAYETVRDKAYFAEIDAYIADFVGDLSGTRTLDICCGSGRLRTLAHDAALVAGVDVAQVAVDLARSRHEDAPAFQFLVMDAEVLGFADKCFDVVLFVDAIEHVHDADRVIGEIARVIRPGGRLFLTVANTDSINQIMSEKLGYVQFKTNYQHVQEFNLASIEHMLGQHGFSISRSGGIFLFPYWGIPGIDEVVKPLIDSDPEIVELFRVLGRRIGPEHAYAFAVLAHKKPDS